MRGPTTRISLLDREFKIVSLARERARRGYKPGKREGARAAAAAAAAGYSRATARLPQYPRERRWRSGDPYRSARVYNTQCAYTHIYTGVCADTIIILWPVRLIVPTYTRTTSHATATMWNVLCADWREPRAAPSGAGVVSSSSSDGWWFFAHTFAYTLYVGEIVYSVYVHIIYSKSYIPRAALWQCVRIAPCSAAPWQRGDVAASSSSSSRVVGLPLRPRCSRSCAADRRVGQRIYTLLSV